MVHGFWYALGEYDGYSLWEAPNSAAMAAVAIAISGGGALPKFETTEPLTGEQTIEALGRAETIRYRRPRKWDTREDLMVDPREPDHGPPRSWSPPWSTACDRRGWQPGLQTAVCRA